MCSLAVLTPEVAGPSLQWVRNTLLGAPRGIAQGVIGRNAAGELAVTHYVCHKQDEEGVWRLYDDDRVKRSELASPIEEGMAHCLRQPRVVLYAHEATSPILSPSSQRISFPGNGSNACFSVVSSSQSVQKELTSRPSLASPRMPLRGAGVTRPQAALMAASAPRPQVGAEETLRSNSFVVEEKMRNGSEKQMSWRDFSFSFLFVKIDLRARALSTQENSREKRGVSGE